MAVKVPGTQWDPLGPQTQPKMARHDIVCVHTMAGYFNYTNDMFHANGYGGLESHMGMRADGFTKQWQDLEYTADANGEGNHRIISIETEDHGPAFNGWTGNGIPPWTDKQLDELIRIIDWCCNRYDIPKQLIPDTKPTRRGIGYHRQGVNPWRVHDGELWSPSYGKVCPDKARISQLTNIIIPALGDDMVTKAEHDAIMSTEQRSTAMYKALRNDADADKDLVKGIRDHMRAVIDEESSEDGSKIRRAMLDTSKNALVQYGAAKEVDSPSG